MDMFVYTYLYLYVYAYMYMYDIYIYTRIHSPSLKINIDDAGGICYIHLYSY
jgi:hypothetical protein